MRKREDSPMRPRPSSRSANGWATNISHFIKVFRMSTGQTPNEYRKYMLQEEMEHER